MPKRWKDEDSDDYIERKMKKIEKKLRKRKKRSTRRVSSSSDSRNSSLVLSPHEDGHDPLIPESIELSEQFSPTIQDVELEPITGPSTSVPAVSEECMLDDEILELLGASPSKSKKMGDKIHKDIALRWEHIATSGLSKETRKDLLSKHLVTENCPKLSAPLLNLEIKAALSDTLIGKDKASEGKQNQITAVISCIGEALTRMLNTENKDTSIIKPLLEGAQLLCDFNFHESMKRRSLICATIKKDIKSQLYETKIDTYLFGVTLADTLRAAKAISKSGSEIKASKPKAVASRAQLRNLNSRPPLANSRQPVRRRQGPAVYHSASAAPLPLAPSQRQYYPALVPVLPHPPPHPPPPPLPMPPPPPLPPQQRSRQRPCQRR